MADRLAGVHPKLVEAVGTILAHMQELGHPMKVAQGVRTAAYQHELWRQGREISGPRVRPGHPLGSTVTNCDGYKDLSNHQAKADGFGHAVDLCFVDDPRTPKDETWDEALWRDVAPKMWAVARALGLKCGADWPHPDRPHLELP